MWNYNKPWAIQWLGKKVLNRPIVERRLCNIIEPVRRRRTSVLFCEYKPKEGKLQLRLMWVNLNNSRMN